MPVKELTDRAVREGRGPDLVGNGRPESVTITSSGYVQMDRQGLDLSLELREAFAGEITVDCGTVELLPNIGPAVRIFNIYNRNTLATVNLRNELQDAHPWIVAGDMNAHHLSWSRADRDPSEDWRNVLRIVNAGTLAFERGTGLGLDLGDKDQAQLI
jgi:hypothetical protein